MTIVTKNQSLARWDTLPDSLREALYSEPNSDFLWKTAAAENIPEEKIYDVARVAGFVLLGFLHPEDVGQELVEVLKIDAKTGKDIQDALIGRIFTPLRADIDKAYSPLSKAEVSSGPVAIDLKPLQGVAIAAKPIQQKPTTLSDVGWSKASSSGPGITLTTMPSAVQPPRPSSATPVPSPAAVPGAPAEPAPMILHEDTTFKAAGKNAGFTLSRPGSGAEVPMVPGGPQAPQKPAVLEFGGANNKPPAPANKLASTPSSGAVHYTELTLSLSAIPTADSGPRNVSQMVSPAAAPTPMPAPKPPTPPAPPVSSTVPLPVPPRPPQAPQPPQASPSSKPIVKDFL